MSATIASELGDPGVARDRTALAWTRSALNMAASGTLIVRGAFTARLNSLGVLGAVTMVAMTLLTWRRGQAIYRERRPAGLLPLSKSHEFGLLTAATMLIATAAILVSITVDG